MSKLIVRERGEQETDVARDWWRLPPHTSLPLENGQRCILLYNGYPGGPAGPDVRDAVLRILPRTLQEKECQLVGDVEFHLRASDWFTHGHQHDPRYNRVILHIVRYLDNRSPIRRQDGAIVPTCSLLDLPQPPLDIPEWPCQRKPLTASAITSTLLYAGLRRFNEKSQNLSQALAETRSLPGSGFTFYDTCLIPALAEGLGYGRDRAFFRVAGQRLVGLPAPLPEPLGRAPGPAPLDANRLRILRVLSMRWSKTGAWQTLLRALQLDENVKAAITALRAVFQPLSQARTDILVINIVLPFTCAVAALENNVRLAARAQQIYLAYPGLVSNRVTRMMSAQLHLPGEPGQACLQQGLHDIYTRTCQSKNCQACLCGGQRL